MSNNEETKPLTADKQVSLIVRNKVLYAEIKSMQQQYVRIQKQINDLVSDQKDIVFNIQKKYDESQNNAEKLEKIEFELLTKYGK